MLFKNFRQDLRIADASVEASGAQRSAEKAHTRLERLDERLSHLAMLTEAMWSLLKSKTGWTDEMLMHELHQIDIADGTIDQRRTPRAVLCHACQRKVPADGRDCIYCGAPPVMNSPFSKVW
ncbi:MAG: hypothetical protein U1F81_14800 [Verrucomicrobiaceae bacterium]